MQETLKAVQEQAQTWLGDYGYGAVAPALLIDPVGVPWAWIFLMLLAEEAGLSVILMLLGGCAVMSAFDWLLYALGWFGGRRLVERLGRRYPKFAEAAHSAEAAVRERGALAGCA